jgi:hypothetical protein
VTVSDLSNKEAAVSKSIEQKFEVLPRGFGIVQLYSAADADGKIPAPLVGVAGQALFVHFAVMDFQRDATSKQPDITIEMVVYDKDKKPTLASPTVKKVPDEADGKVDEKVVGVPMRFLVPLNREGGFLIQLKATDNLTKKTSIVYLPLRVFPAGN